MNEKDGVGLLKKLLSSGKLPVLLAVIFVFGVILVLFSGGGDEKNEGEAVTDNGTYYAAQLEKKLVDMISGLDGAGSVQVMITLEGSSKSLYAKDSSSSFSSDGTDESYQSSGSVVFGSGSVSTKEPVSVGERYPEVRGVAVVCDGAVNSGLCARITELVGCALNISSNRICVTN